MKPRCTGTKVDGHFTGFICVLDAGHAGFCEPYVPPTVDEWRRVGRIVANLRGDIAACAEAVGGCLTHEQTGRGAESVAQAVARFAAERREDEQTLWQMRKNDGAMIRQMRKDVEAATSDRARLQAELDALRAILASGCDACAHAAPKHPVSQEATLAEMRGLLDDDEPERTDP